MSLKTHFFIIFFIISISKQEKSALLTIIFSSNKILSYETMEIKIQTTYNLISQGFSIKINDSSKNYENSPKYSFNSNITEIKLSSIVNDGNSTLSNDFNISDLSIEIFSNFSNQNQTNSTNWYIFTLTNVPTPPDVGSYTFYLHLKEDENPIANQKITFLKKNIKSGKINTNSKNVEKKIIIILLLKIYLILFKVQKS